MIFCGIRQRWRRLMLTLRGVKVDPSCRLGPCVSVGDVRSTGNSEGVNIGPACELSRGVELNPWGGHIRIGKNVFLGPYVVIYGHGGVEIGDNSLIAMHCCIVSSNHTVPSRAEFIRFKSDKLLATKIGTDVWLGAGVKVMGGVSIGDGCVVGAGAVVVKDLPPYSISVGVPAKVVGFRE